MAFARVNLVLQDDDGTLVDGASVEVRNEATLALAPVFSDRAGTASLGNPFTAADGADAGFYVAGGAYKITATLGAFSKTIRYQAAGLAAETDIYQSSTSLGIGTTTPLGQFEINHDGIATADWGAFQAVGGVGGGGFKGLTITGTLDNSANITMQTIGSDAQSLIEWLWYRVRGVPGAPLPLLSTSIIGQMQFTGKSTNNAFAFGGLWNVLASGDWTDTSTPAHFNFYSTPVGSTSSVLSLKIDGAGTTVLGTTTNNDAAAGFVGEFIEQEVTSPVSLTSGVAANIASISLTAGDWDVWGTVNLAPAGSTTVSGIKGSINTTSATHPSGTGKGAVVDFNITFLTGFGQTTPVGQRRLSLSATTTVFLVMTASFAVSTATGTGYIAARRVR